MLKMTKTNIIQQIWMVIFNFKYRISYIQHYSKNVCIIRPVEKLLMILDVENNNIRNLVQKPHSRVQWRTHFNDEMSCGRIQLVLPFSPSLGPAPFLVQVLFGMVPSHVPAPVLFLDPCHDLSPYIDPHSSSFTNIFNNISEKKIYNT